MTGLRLQFLILKFILTGFILFLITASAIDELECGAYDFKLTAGEIWYFEPITVKDFTITENAYTIRDDLMLPFKFSEQQFETITFNCAV